MSISPRSSGLSLNTSTRWPSGLATAGSRTSHPSRSTSRRTLATMLRGWASWRASQSSDHPLSPWSAERAATLRTWRYSPVSSSSLARYSWLVEGSVARARRGVTAMAPLLLSDWGLDTDEASARPSGAGPMPPSSLTLVGYHHPALDDLGDVVGQAGHAPLGQVGLDLGPVGVPGDEHGRRHLGVGLGPAPLQPALPGSGPVLAVAHLA